MDSGNAVPSFSSVDAEETSGEDGCDVKLTKGQPSLDGDWVSSTAPAAVREGGFLENRRRLSL